jgi:NAD+ synthase (glutamine-hydrolysing)
MQQELSVLMAQVNPTVGAIEANANLVIQCIEQHQHNHDVIVFPELVLTGYSPEDLLLRDELYTRVDAALENIKATVKDCHVIVGHPSKENHHRYNSASVLHNSKMIDRYHKQLLPNYGVFDEKRYFSPGEHRICSFEIKGHNIALCICEDMWDEGPVDSIIKAGNDVLLCINASPFDHEKYKRRETLLRHYAKQNLTIVYVNLVGGQDQIVFDGQSFVMNSNGEVCARSPAFETSLQSISISDGSIEGSIAPITDTIPLIYQALVLGLRDYIHKNHFSGVLLGLSGGIDSALTLAIAVDALGADNVHAVMMPSRFTADISKEDALQQLNTLKVEHTTLPITQPFNTILETLATGSNFSGHKTTEENIQARIRGLYLMALSNQSGKMVVTTSNKSETAVGYATIYGDMVGGLAVLKDVYKTQVYQLAAYRNSLSYIIPERVLVRAPSAELSENQTDQDTLPEYSVLDGIIHAYMEQNESAEMIIKQGYNAKVVNDVIRLIKINEYKRRQSAPGIKVSARSFDLEWRYPITSGY